MLKNQPNPKTSMEKKFRRKFGKGLWDKPDKLTEKQVTKLLAFINQELLANDKQVEKQARQAKKKLKNQIYEAVNLPYDENTFEHGVNEGLNQGIISLNNLKDSLCK